MIIQVDAAPENYQAVRYEILS